MAMNDVTAARYKRRLGLKLTDVERDSLREYESKYLASKISIHANPETKTRWAAQAAHTGRSLSGWLAEQVENSMHPSDGALRQARDENQALRDEVAMLRRQNGQLSSDNGNLQTRLQDMERRLIENMAKLLDAKGERA
jgi:uncharacterized protein YllA (UPF0747 family)